MTKLLDCTIRDGGHLNGWNFEPECVRASYYAAVKAGADIFEIGYRFKTPKPEWGLFAKCNDDMLLNLITEEYSPDFSTKVFCNVLNKLNDAGFNTELLDSIYNIYSLSDNYFDYDLLNSIDSKLILKYREK